VASSSTAPCVRCDADIPADAIECPECGYEHPWGRTNRLVVALVSGTALLFSVVGTVSVAAGWLLDGGGASIGQLATWLVPGLFATAMLSFALRRPPRTATGGRGS